MDIPNALTLTHAFPFLLLFARGY